MVENIRKPCSFQCLLLLSFLVIMSTGVFGQSEWPGFRNCKELKLDTIEANFIMEVNSNSRFYSTEDAIFQKNLIFIDTNYDCISNPRLTYQNDSVFIYYWSDGFKYFKSKSCIDIVSISKFQDMTENSLNKKKYRKKINENVVKNKDGILYLKFHARVSVLNIQNLEWNVPWIYCDIDTTDKKKYRYCKRKFINTFLFVSVLDFKYNSEYTALKKVK